jgi:hypothetical protein
VIYSDLLCGAPLEFPSVAAPLPDQYTNAFTTLQLYNLPHEAEPAMKVAICCHARNEETQGKHTG